MAGQIVHLEISASDTGSAKEFWSGLLGWEFEEFPGSPTEYHTARLSDTQGAAITTAGAGMRPYFDVDDVNAGAAKVRELGGSADDPLPVPGMGWFATCTDTQGNPFGLWQTDESAQMPS